MIFEPDDMDEYTQIVADFVRDYGDQAYHTIADWVQRCVNNGYHLYPDTRALYDIEHIVSTVMVSHLVWPAATYPT